MQDLRSLSDGPLERDEGLGTQHDAPHFGLPIENQRDRAPLEHDAGEAARGRVIGEGCPDCLLQGGLTPSPDDRGLLAGQRDDHHALVPIGPGESRQMGKLLPARKTPRCPEVDDQDLAAPVRYSVKGRRIQRLQLQSKGVLPNLASDCVRKKKGSRRDQGEDE